MSQQQQTLEGRVALVTGASQGIGLAIAQQLAARGVRVVMLARSKDKLDQAAAAIGDTAIAIPTDVGDPDAVRSAFKMVADTFGRLDILVNNAAIGYLGKVENLTDEAIASHMNTNVSGMVYCCREAIALLKQSDCADIINLSSDSVSDPFPYLTLYATTKGAVEVFTKALRRELKPDRIRVTLMRPGPTVTGFAETWDQELAAEAFQVWQAAGYLHTGGDGGGAMDTDTVANTVVFIVSQAAAISIEFLEVRPH